jgi:hypothetical protein
MGTIEITGNEAVKYLNKINNSLGYLNQYVLDEEVMDGKKRVAVLSNNHEGLDGFKSDTTEYVRFKPSDDARGQKFDDLIIMGFELWGSEICQQLICSIANSSDTPLFNYFLQMTKAKPLPVEPIIVKSGDAWVAEYKGVDYLYVGDNLWNGENSFPYLFNENNPKNDMLPAWEPMSEIKITDDIAKLRPMMMKTLSSGEICDVVFMGLRKGILYHDDGASVLLTTKHYFRLATVKDLNTTSL